MKKPTFIISVILLVLLVGVFVLLRWVGIEEISAQVSSVIGYLGVQSNSGKQYLRVVSVNEAVSAGKGVVKIQMPSGTGAAELVETSHVDASPVRLRTPYGTKSWKRAPVFCQLAGGASGESGNDVIQTSDGGYLVAGSTNSFGAGQSDLLLVKFNRKGLVEWARTVGGAKADVGVALQQTADGGYVVAGSTESFSTGPADFFLVKFNSAGSLVWARAVGASGAERANSLAATSDGGFIVIGSTNTYGGTPQRPECGRNKILVTKFNTGGSLLWAKTVGGPDSNYECPSERGNSVIQTADNGYIIAGSSWARWTYSTAGGNLFFVKLDVNGDLGWSRVFCFDPGAGYITTVGYDVVQSSSDQGYVIAGATSGSYNVDRIRDVIDRVLLLKLSSAGALQWTRLALLDIANAAAPSVVEAADGGYMAIGNGNYARTLHCLKVDTAGNLQWDRKIAGEYFWVGNKQYFRNRAAGSSILQATDGGNVIAGGFADGETGSTDLLLVKLEPNGFGCLGNYRSISWGGHTLTPYVVNPGSQLQVIDRSLTVTSPSPTVTSPSLTNTSCCE